LEIRFAADKLPITVIDELGLIQTLRDFVRQKF
jgi:hypothetical protein